MVGTERLVMDMYVGELAFSFLYLSDLIDRKEQKGLSFTETFLFLH